MQARRLVFRPQVLLVVVLAYPLLYMVPYIDQDIGFVLENVVLLPLTAFVALLAVAQGHHIIKRTDVRIYALFLVLTIIIGANSADLRYAKALLFIVSLFITYHFISGMKPAGRDRVVGYILLLYLLASTAALAMPSRFAILGRFSGFTLSPTVFSVFLEAVLIVFLFTKRPAYLKVAATIAVGIFVLMSGTRLNVLFLLGLPFQVLAVRWLPRYRGLMQVGILIVLNLLYPAYAFFTQSTGFAVTAGREGEDNVDTSFALRFALFTTVAVELSTSSPRELLLGHGAGTTRELVLEIADNLPHNDFLVLAMDFGVPALLLFLYLLYCIASRSTRSFLLLNLYFVAFYHNMVYSYYLLFLIIYYSFIPDSKDSQESPATASAPIYSAPA